MVVLAIDRIDWIEGRKRFDWTQIWLQIWALIISKQ